MKADILPIPGIVLGAYPERRAPGTGGGRGPGALADLRARLFAGGALARYPRFVEQVERADAGLGTLDAAGMDAQLRATRAGMAREGLTDALVAQAFALVKRVCMSELKLEPFATQLIAARIMLDRKLAEMATGEGKTLAAGLCAATAALAGIPVHVITANEYLVKRDAETLKPLYAALGLTVGAITQDSGAERRRAVYACDIVYCTASELVFDYLRDGLTREPSRSDLQARVAALSGAAPAARGTLLRGLCMAIVDEADSILIDDARVPLILSERCDNADEREYHAAALHIAGRLVEGRHFALRRSTMSAELNDAGREVVDTLAEGLPWRNRLHRYETVCTALAALHLYEKDRHYLVRDRAITIIDESTGRLAHGRVWSRGLHRLIEMKEECDAGAETVTVAQITYQRFFQRYLSLCGMSGTLAEARGELAAVYGLAVAKVPLRRPSLRNVLPTRVYPDRFTQWDAAVRQALEVSRSGRPVLIGTDSVAESEALSLRLAKENAPHAVLNAAQDSAEAEVISAAGRAGQITVATNMAGRGTDIALDDRVAAQGGLHVISCQHNASRRIDRQLLGRCARRGDPGSAQTLLALDKPLVAPWVPGWLARRVTADGLDRPQWLVRWMVEAPQRREERRGRRQRSELLKRDQDAQRRLAFGRPTE